MVYDSSDRMMLYDRSSCRMMLYDRSSCRMMLYDGSSCRMMHDGSSCRMMLYDGISCGIMLYDSMSRYGTDTQSKNVGCASSWLGDIFWGTRTSTKTTLSIKKCDIMKRYLCYENVISWRLVETSSRTHFRKLKDGEFQARFTLVTNVPSNSREVIQLSRMVWINIALLFSSEESVKKGEIWAIKLS